MTEFAIEFESVWQVSPAIYVGLSRSIFTNPEYAGETGTCIMTKFAIEFESVWQVSPAIYVGLSRSIFTNPEYAGETGTCIMTKFAIEFESVWQVSPAIYVGLSRSIFTNPEYAGETGTCIMTKFAIEFESVWQVSPAIYVGLSRSIFTNPDRVRRRNWYMYARTSNVCTMTKNLRICLASFARRTTPPGPAGSAANDDPLVMITVIMNESPGAGLQTIIPPAGGSGRKWTAPTTKVGNPICNPDKSDERTLSVADKDDVRIGSGIDKGDALMGSTVDKGDARVGSAYRQRQHQHGMIRRQRQRASGAKTGSRPCAVPPEATYGRGGSPAKATCR
ncbi:hypothetical protein C8F04DRAFT_1200292 [Mycena alexandri]|uniref:Uncharacterized protein n=1 Tax=Mycena alexandri TaxID=1745969 RepID=A0AAD6RZQ2_9AGAR|nr:hypothetical protein C8F04DRAFT_1200292 [Mycena alexandri]